MIAESETPDIPRRKRRSGRLKYAVFVAVVLVWAWAAFAPSDMGHVFADISFDDALARAAAEHKPVFIAFRKDWCPSCKLLERTTFSSPDVQQFLKANAIPLHVDAERQIDLSRRYQVSALPTMVAVDANGDVLKRVVGYLDSKQFIDAFSESLTGKPANPPSPEHTPAAS